MAKPSQLHDEVVYKQVIEDLALGIPQSTIAKALGVDPNTVWRWTQRRDIRRDLALKEIELAREPIESVKKQNPERWLSKKFKDEWQPEIPQGNFLALMLSGRNLGDLISIAQRGSDSGSDNGKQD